MEPFEKSFSTCFSGEAWSFSMCAEFSEKVGQT